MLEIRICRVSESDVATLCAISAATFIDTFKDNSDLQDMLTYSREAFSKSTMLREVQNTASEFYFCYVEGVLAGYMKLNVGTAQTEPRGDDALEVQRLYLYPAFQGTGCGSKLFDLAVTRTRELGKQRMWLGAWEENVKAMTFYKRKGMREVGIHHFIMGETDDVDIIMELSLKDKK